jgi:predicted dehydrogenase
MDFTRRDFIRTAAVAGAGALLTSPAWGDEPQAAAPAGRPINAAFIGIGSQGRNLLNNALKIPGIQFKAICDIWPYSQKFASGILKKYGQIVNVYSDYADMLAKEKDVECVIVATPDWMHAPCTNAALKAGKHVYCEKEMAHTVEAAKSMVTTARETGQLLQIGHQRRSEPMYFHALHNMIEKENFCGRITSINGQWNRNQMLERDWGKKYEMSAEDLAKYGYGSMDELCNWRWYRKYSGGPMADLGSHQVDVYSWFLHTNPSAVTASGGLDYYTEEKTGKKRDWYDNVMAIYEYHTPAGMVRAFYQVLNTTSQGGYFETFMGDQGTVTVSEDNTKATMFHEAAAKKHEWEDQSEVVEKAGKSEMSLKIGETLTADGKKDPKAQAMLAESLKPPHQLHLENFFNTVRDPKGSKLNCPPEVGFETTVAIMATNQAVAERRTIDIPAEAYKV